MLWGIVGMLVGLWIALELVFPALNLDVPWLSFGRLRPLHTNAVIFAFVGNGIFMGVYYSLQRLMKARILLKADTSQTGGAWRDSQIAEALDTSIDTVGRTRQRLVEEGIDAVLTRKHSPASARLRVFDGAAEAKLIALACSEPPKGRARWTLRLLEEKVVELNIVGRASDNTIGRTLKKTLSNRIAIGNG